MAIELRVKEFSALPVADDGKTLLYADGSVKQSSKNLSEMLTDEINNKLDTTAFSTVSGSFLTAHQVIPSGKWENASNVVIANSAIWESETDWTEDINAASAYAYEQAVAQIPDPFDPTFLSGEIDKKLDKTFSSNFYPRNENPNGYLTEHQDLSNYYTKLETSSKLELTDEFNTKQNIIKNKKDSSIPYLETSGSDPSWETIETSTINAHGTAVEGELYDIPINGRTYKTVCINGKLWLAENYVNEAKATYTHPKYGSYFNKATINSVTFVPQGWHIPSKEEWQELIDYTENHENYLSTTDWHQGTNYIQGTNELKLNILPGGEYNPGRQEISSEYYQARFWTSTDEILSQSTGKQRVYAIIKNYIGYNSKIISFDWDGPGSLYYFPVRLIKDDLEVPAPDGWKKFNGRNFMAIADDEGNTFKDFYLKTSAAQQLYQPKGDYASSASVTVLNTYYGLTTTGWKDISTNYYDKQTIDSMITGGATGEYVPLSALRCTIGSGNEVNTSTSYFALAQGSANSAKEDAFAQGNSNYANDKSIAQGKNNSALYTSFAQGNSNYANNYCFTQGYKNSASNYGLAQGTANSAVQESFANGISNTAQYFSIAVGNTNSANQKSLAVGMNNTASYMGITIGTANSANMAFACGEKSIGYLKSVAIGYKTSADNMGVAFGDEVSAYRDALAQGGSAIAKNNSLAQGYSVSANEQAFAQGSTVIASGNAFAQGQQVTATNTAMAQGVTVKADNKSFAQGYNVWVYEGGNSFGQGNNVNASYSSMAQGVVVSANSASLAQGVTVTATDNSLAQGLEIVAESASFAQGYQNSAIFYSIAQGYGNTATNYAQAFGNGVIISAGMAIGTYNKTSANVAFVIGNGTNSTRNDLFTIDKSGVASGGDFITSAGKKLSDCITSLPTITEYVAGTGIVFTAGTGVNEGKTVIEVDSTNYKLLTTAEYNDLTAAAAIVAANSAKWVLTN